MIYLFTGSPGAGKTLSLLKFVTEGESFKNRPVYCFGIRGLNIPEWNSIDEKQAKDWQSLPDGSIVIFDEAQQLYRPRKAGDSVPDFVSGLETHRHRGFDFFLTTQSPMLIDTHVRRLVYQHRHLERPFGFKQIRCLLWQKCVNDPDDHFNRKECTKSSVKLDKRIFSLYESAELHTVKRQIPTRLYLLALLLLALVGLIFSFVQGFRSRHLPPVVPGQTPAVVVPQKLSRLTTGRPALTYVDGCLVDAARGVCQCYNSAVSHYCKRSFRMGELDYSGTVGTMASDQAQPAALGPT